MSHTLVRRERLTKQLSGSSARMVTTLDEILKNHGVVFPVTLRQLEAEADNTNGINTNPLVLIAAAHRDLKKFQECMDARSPDTVISAINLLDSAARYLTHAKPHFKNVSAYNATTDEIDDMQNIIDRIGKSVEEQGTVMQYWRKLADNYSSTLTDGVNFTQLIPRARIVRTGQEEPDAVTHVGFSLPLNVERPVDSAEGTRGPIPTAKTNRDTIEKVGFVGLTEEQRKKAASQVQIFY